MDLPDLRNDDDFEAESTVICDLAIERAPKHPREFAHSLLNAMFFALTYAQDAEETPYVRAFGNEHDAKMRAAEQFIDMLEAGDINTDETKARLLDDFWKTFVKMFDGVWKRSEKLSGTPAIRQDYVHLVTRAAVAAAVKMALVTPTHGSVEWSEVAHAYITGKYNDGEQPIEAPFIAAFNALCRDGSAYPLGAFIARVRELTERRARALGLTASPRRQSSSAEAAGPSR